MFQLCCLTHVLGTVEEPLLRFERESSCMCTQILCVFMLIINVNFTGFRLYCFHLHNEKVNVVKLHVHKPTFNFKKRRFGWAALSVCTAGSLSLCNIIGFCD